MNKPEILKRLLLLAEYFKEEISTTSQEIYLKALSKYKDEQIFQAIEEAMFLQYFPRLHAFKDLIEGNEGDKALEAWQNVLDTISRKGSYNSYEFEDKKIHSAIQACGGLLMLADCPLDELQWRQKEFERTYNSRKGGHPEYLVGRTEIENSKIGLPTERVQIGDCEPVKELTEPQKKIKSLTDGIGNE